jgi:hypothetical protein
MKKQIYVLEGSYRSKKIENQVFEMVKPYHPYPHKPGGFVTVKVEDIKEFPGATDKEIRVSVESESQLRDKAPEAPKEESDTEVVERLRKRFDILTDMTKACKRGDVRAMIVSGPPGVGKSFGVEAVLQKHDILATLGDSKPKYEVVKGAMSALGLYCKLYHFKEKDNVLVFDDCDSILLEDLSLNILKAALDSKRTRRICWNTEAYRLREEGVPSSFEFKGSAIFITNIKFDNVKSKKLRDHLEALESRSHYIDLTIDTIREKILRIRQIVTDGMLKEYELTPETENQIVEFVVEHQRRLREISLRTVLKVADLAKAFPDTWAETAVHTILKPR